MTMKFILRCACNEEQRLAAQALPVGASGATFEWAKASKLAGEDGWRLLDLQIPTVHGAMLIGYQLYCPKCVSKHA